MRDWWHDLKHLVEGLIDEAGLAIEVACGSHDLEPLTEGSDRRIVIAMRRR